MSSDGPPQEVLIYLLASIVLLGVFYQQFARRLGKTGYIAAASFAFALFVIPEGDLLLPFLPLTLDNARIMKEISKKSRPRSPVYTKSRLRRDLIGLRSFAF